VAAAALPEPAPEVQAVFCIDVRSERMRRALEAVWPAVQTRGFAGFFGLPAAYTPLGTALARPHLPGLLAPSVTVGEVIEDARGHGGPGDATARAAAARQRGLDRRARWEAAGRWPGAAFSYVEAAGVGYLGRLAGWLRPMPARVPRPTAAACPRATARCAAPRWTAWTCRPRWTWPPACCRAWAWTAAPRPWCCWWATAARAPTTPRPPRWTAAPAAARPARSACAPWPACSTSPRCARAWPSGLPLGEHTRFVAALHNTATDEMVWFDLDQQPAATQAALAPVQAAFEHAADQVRRERAPRWACRPRCRLRPCSARCAGAPTTAPRPGPSGA
jgi:hypothetical protein